MIAAIACILACGLAHAQDMLQLDAPAPQPLRSVYLQHRIDDLSRHNAATHDDWRADARAAYVATAVALLESAKTAQAPDLAAVIGLTLADGLADLDALLAAAPASSPLLDPMATPDRGARALAGEAEVMFFTRKALGPLIVVQQTVDPQTVWASAWPQSPPPPTAEDLAALELRIHALPVPPQVRQPLAAIAASLKQAARFGEFLPMVDESCRDVTIVIDLVELSEQSSWFAPEMRQALHDELARTLADYRDPLARSRASLRLRELRALTWVMRETQTWSTQSAAAARTAQMLAVNTAQVQLNAATPAAQRRAVLRWHQRVRDALRATEGLAQPSQQTLRTAYLQAERDLATAIDGVTRASATMAQTPMTVSAPATGEAVRTLRSRADALAAVSRLRDAIDAADAFKPVPPMGVRQRLIRQAEAARDPAQRDRALAEIVRFVFQFDRYAKLPMEDDVRRGATAGGLLAGKTAELAKAIDAARAAWASAWAAGDDARAAADAIEPLRATLALAARARPIDMTPGWTLVPDLDAWAAWQGDPESMRLLLLPLEQTLARLIDDAARGDVAALQRTMQTLEQEHTLALTLLRLAEGLAGRRDALPRGMTGVLAQALFVPADDAYMSEHRAAIAQLNRCLNEWARADEPGQIDLRLRAIDIVRRFRADLPTLD